MIIKRKKILEQAKKAIVKNKLLFIDDIVAYLPISKLTFYKYYPVGSDELNELKELLKTNRT